MQANTINATGKICPQCGKILQKIVVGNKLMYLHESGDCVYTEIEMALSETENTVDSEVCDKYISIIAHEYKRLLSMFKNNEIYGAMLEMKDVFEILLKLPVLIKTPFLYYYGNSSDKCTVLSLMLKKPLALGDWVSIGQKIKHISIPQMLPEIQHILEDVLRLYGRNNLVKWRNENIGHGALMIDANGIKQDVETKINILRDHFQKCNQDYLKLYLQSENSFSSYKGYNGNISKYTESPIRLVTEAENYDLRPFIDILKDGVCFYDSYLQNRGVQFIDYIKGCKYYRDIEFYKILFSNSNFAV